MSTKMEQPFYHDDSFLSAYHASDSSMLLKQSLTLNLTEAGSSYLGSKPNLFPNHHHHNLHLLQDVGSLKLASPELERLILQNSSGGGVLTTPTPGSGGQYFYNRITDEQEGFAEGFVKALDELHKINQVHLPPPPPPPPNVSLGGAGVATSCGAGVTSSSSGVFAASSSSLQQQHQSEPPVYTTLNAYCPNTTTSVSSSYPTTTINYLPPHQQNHHHLSSSTQTSVTSAPHPLFHHHHPSSATTSTSALLHPQRLSALKEEPQTVPDLLSSDGGSPPMSPIDMEDQERIKAERKRLRNRLAATKCRKRKLERISRLEDKVKVLKSDNAGLSSHASTLRDQVAQLKHKVLTHVSSGCQLMLTSKMEAF